MLFSTRVISLTRLFDSGTVYSCGKIWFYLQINISL